MLKEFLDDNTFSIIIKKNYLNIINFDRIDTLEDKKIIITCNSNRIIINGNNLHALKLLNDEILIKGLISNIEFG